MFSLAELEHPIVQAPMGGGPSTPALAAAVSDAGGLGFLAAGYKTAEAVAGDLRALRELTGRPFGLNVFAPPAAPAEREAVERYASTLCDEPGALGEPRWHDDGWEEKLAVAAREHVPVVSVTFGCPAPAVVETLQRSGAAVWVTVTTAQEARDAERAGADALVLQGVEAGGHRGSFDDGAPGDVGLLALLQLVAGASRLPMVATGGIATGRGVAAVLAAGASAAQLGTAFMLADEAATSAPHRRALQGEGRTALTRAFTGRTARGLVNRFLAEHDADAPAAYPEVHHLTAPLRAAARERGDPDGLNLWAGQAHPLVHEGPAAELVRRLAAEAREALDEAARHLGD